MQYTRSARPVFCKNKTQKARTKHKKMKESSMNVRFTLSLRSLATAGIIALALPLAAQATNITFTDAVLKAYVVAHYDKDGDSEISEAEALLVTAIKVSGGYDTTAAQSGTKTKIASFADIANFPNLDTLDCSLNSLTSLDVSKNTKLTYLYCCNNQLTTLDVSKNTKLTALACFGNQLTSLDVSKNTSLTSLCCNNNQLTALDVSKNTSLTKLNCSNNQLTALDVSENTSLTLLDCSSGSLTTLDVSKNTSLTMLSCFGNQLTSLDVSANTSLTDLYCYNNQLTALDVSKNTSLMTLICSGNRLTRLDARTMAAAGVYCGNQDIDGDGTSSTAETDTLFLTAAQLTVWNASYKSRTDNANVVATSAIPFTNAVLKAYVVAHYDKDGDSEISEAEALLVTAIKVSGGYDTTAAQSGTKTKIASFADIANFPNLDTLDCSLNSLTSLDVSKNTKLTYLDCFNNQLTSLDVSKNTKLTALACFGNQLTSLDVSKNTSLTSLCCNNNQLTALDVSKNTSLTTLYCYNNQLTALDVSKNTSLTNLNCSDNQLTALDVSENTSLTLLDCSSDSLTTLDVSKNTSLTMLICFGNQLTSLDVSANTSLTDLYCYNNQLTALDVSKNTSLMTLICSGNRLTRLDARTMAAAGVYCGNQDIDGDGTSSTAETDTLFLTAAQLTVWNASYKSRTDNANVVATSAIPFTNAVLKAYVVAHYDKDGDSEISEAEALLVTAINVYGGYDTTKAQSGTKTKIASFADIANFPNLDTLDCSGNELAVLDVSKNTKLTYLACYDNQLTSLDVSKNTELTVLYCAYDQLTSLDVSANASLATLFCYHNRLTSLDVSKNTKLMYLDCSLNSLTAVHVSKTPRLTQFYCHNNQLTSLDVSTNTSLKLLFCQGNRLTRVDARTMAAAEVYCGNQDIDGDGSPSTAETDTLFLTASQLTKWNASYKSDERNTNIVATSATPFTDAVLKAYVVAHYDGSDGTAKDGEISEAEALLVTAINVYGGYDTTVAQSGTKTKIASFADIANFPNLDTLDCALNSLTSLDVSKNTKLTYLACYDNQLTSLDVSANTLLTYLGCGHNQLTSLDVSANTSLTQLSCNGNRLTRLDARTMAAAEVYCGNQDINGDGSPSTAETDTLFLTASQLTKWNASYKSDEYNTNVVATSATPFTDAVLKAYVVAHYDGSDGTAKDGEISEAEALLVTVIKVYGGYD